MAVGLALAALAAGGPGPALAAELVEVAVAEGEDGFDAVAADPEDPSRLWAASGARVFGSGDGGRTWRERFRLPGGPAGSGRIDGGPDASADRAGFAPATGVAEGLDGEDADDPGAGVPAEGGALDGGPPAEGGADGSAGPTSIGEPIGARLEARGARIRGLRVGPDGLWVAADDAAYRWTAAGGGLLARFAVPGGGPVFAVAPDPLQRGAAWLATARGLFHADDARIARAAGLSGTTAALDVDSVRAGARAVVAAATEVGLFVSADGGLAFAGPFAVGRVGAPVAAVRLGPDGRATAASPDGVLAKVGPAGPVESSIVPGLGRDVRRLHLAGAALWVATGEGLFRIAAGGVAAPVSRGLPTVDVRDVVTPAGLPERPLVATDRGLFATLADEGVAGDRRGRPPSGPGGRGERRRAGRPADVAVASLARSAEVHLGLAPLDAACRHAWAPLLPIVDASWSAGPADPEGGRATFAVTARWDLARLLGPGSVSASPAERRLHAARRSLSLRLERALRARDRLLLAAGGVTGDAVDDALALLSVDEQTARLDGLTGGRFSAAAGGPGAWRSTW